MFLHSPRLTLMQRATAKLNLQSQFAEWIFPIIPRNVFRWAPWRSDRTPTFWECREYVAFFTTPNHAGQSQQNWRKMSLPWILVRKTLRPERSCWFSTLSNCLKSLLIALWRDSCLLISAFMAVEYTDLLLLFILTHGSVVNWSNVLASAHLNSWLFVPQDENELETHTSSRKRSGGGSGCLTLSLFLLLSLSLSLQTTKVSSWQRVSQFPLQVWNELNSLPYFKPYSSLRGGSGCWGDHAPVRGCFITWCWSSCRHFYHCNAEFNKKKIWSELIQQ